MALNEWNTDAERRRNGSFAGRLSQSTPMPRAKINNFENAEAAPGSTGEPPHEQPSARIRLEHSEGGNAVANRAETTITLTDAPHDDDIAVIADGLRAYNETQAGYSAVVHSPSSSAIPKPRRSSAVCTAAHHWGFCG